MDAIRAEKNSLRKLFKRQRLLMSPLEVANESEKISKNFIENLLPQLGEEAHDKIFSLYLPASNEVDTQIIAQYFSENNIKFCYPKILKRDHPLEFIEAKENQKLTSNKIYPKLLEPTSGNELIPHFLILPLLAFDSKRNRLGMGGGFFDRTICHLKKKNSELITIGLSYDSQSFTGILPSEKTDQNLTFIVSKNKITH